MQKLPHRNHHAAVTILSRRTCRPRCCLAILALLLMGGDAVSGEEPEKPETGGLNIRLPTLGGKQLWSDVYFFHDWRIQRFALSGHHRLLDSEDALWKLGTREECQAKLQRIARQRALPPMQGKAVVLLHGLGRTRGAMKKLAAALAKEGGYMVFNVGYPTTQGSVGDHAQSLQSVVESLEGIDEINFVGHSLGNLVVRRWLHDLEAGKASLGKGQRLGRMVMLAPPNQKPVLAQKVGRAAGAKWIGGASFRELAEGWDELAPTLAVPEMPFGILAGGRDNQRGYNPLIPGDDDMVVSVASTHLAGARDFRLLPLTHTFIMNDAKVHRYTLSFLEHGYFQSEAKRRPLEVAGNSDPR